MHQKAQGENYIPVSAALGLDQWFHDVGLVRRERGKPCMFGWQEHRARISIRRLVSSLGLHRGVGSKRSNVSSSIFFLWSCGQEVPPLSCSKNLW